MAFTAPSLHERTAAGFTLVEIMAVLVILTVMAYLVVPMIGSPHADRLRAAATLLEADLAFAQMASISHTDDLRRMVIAPDGTGYHLANSSDPDAPLFDAITKQPYRVTFGLGRAAMSPGVTISHFDLGGDHQLRFGPYGQLDQTAPATITLAIADHRLTVTIQPSTGQVTIGDIE